MRRPAAIVAGLILLAGCSGDDGPEVTQVDDEPAESSTTTTEPVEAPAEDTVAYFEAFVGEDIARMPEMLEHSRPGSPAHTYAQGRIDLGTLFPRAPIDEEMEIGEDTITITTNTQEGADQNVFGDFEAAANGLLVSFSVDDEPIAPRLAGPGAQGSSSGIGVTLRSAYQARSNETVLVVFIDVSNNTDGPFNDAAYQASYVDDDGRQYPPQPGDSPALTVQPGATAMQSLSFLQAPVGGRLVYKGFLSDFLTEVTVEVPVRAFEDA